MINERALTPSEKEELILEISEILADHDHPSVSDDGVTKGFYTKSESLRIDKVTNDLKKHIDNHPSGGQVEIGVATPEANGLMSKEDKVKLDGLKNFEHPQGNHLPAEAGQDGKVLSVKEGVATWIDMPKQEGGTGGNVDLTELDNRYAKVEHIHDTRYAQRKHSHNEYMTRGEVYNMVEVDNLVGDSVGALKTEVEATFVKATELNKAGYMTEAKADEKYLTKTAEGFLKTTTIDDNVTSATTLWSSTKVDGAVKKTSMDIEDLRKYVGTIENSIPTGVDINDNATAKDSVWSSTKVNNEISSAKSAAESVAFEAINSAKSAGSKADSAKSRADQAYSLANHSHPYASSGHSHNMNDLTGQVLQSNYGYLYLRSLNNNYGGLIIDSDNGYARPEGNGNLSLGTSSERFHGIYLKGNPNVSSDRRLKENIEYLKKDSNPYVKAEELTTDDLYAFVKDDLKLAEYDYTADNREDNMFRHNIGFIAQDLEGTKVGKKFITADEAGMLSYQSGSYVNILAGALQEAIQKIEALEQKVEELKK